MKKIGIVVALLLPVAMAACAKKPEPMATPVLTGPEQACATRAAQVTGADASTVTVVPTASTKTGDTIYTATANGLNYNCVVGPDMMVSTFSAQ